VLVMGVCVYKFVREREREREREKEREIVTPWHLKIHRDVLLIEVPI